MGEKRAAPPREEKLEAALLAWIGDWIGLLTWAKS
jgi:hypothetical protein